MNNPAGRLIYIADDEEHIRSLISAFLQKEGFRVRLFSDGESLLSSFSAQPADLVILDIMMDGLDGICVCTVLRQKSAVPIIIVSARDSEADRITGITAGSDDYLIKPFSPTELVARVKAIFRRIELDSSSRTASSLSYGNVTLCCQTHESSTLTSAGRQNLDLTPTEFTLMVYLFENSVRAVSRTELMQNVWGINPESDTRVVDDVLKRLRKKLQCTTVHIESVWGFGFKLKTTGQNENGVQI